MENVFLVPGDLSAGNDEAAHDCGRSAPDTSAARPPGTVHGPFRSEAGCVPFALHDFDPV